MQARDDVEPSASVVEPSGQRVQFASLVAPRRSEYVAYGHGEHVAVRGALAKVPGVHGAQLVRPAWGAAYPTAQATQALSSAAPTVEDAVPAAQRMHPDTVCPSEGLKVPAGQGWQAPASVAPRVLE